MIVLSHRGQRRDPAEKNSWAALNPALDAGFGLELDIRDPAGDLVILYAPPIDGDLIPFSDAVAAHLSAGEPGALPGNIEAAEPLSLRPKSMTREPLKPSCSFNVSTPEAVGYLAYDFDVFTRRSELEPHPTFYQMAAGVRVDGFKSDRIARKGVETHLSREKSVALDSPKPDGQDHRTAWNRWAEPCHESLIVCTDCPEQAASH